MIRVYMKLILPVIILIASLINMGNSETIWQKDNFKINLENNQILIFHDQDKLLHIEAFAFNFIKPKRVVLEKVIKDTVVFKLSLEHGDGFHADFPEQIDLFVTYSGNTFHFSASHASFNHITIKLKDQNEHYFGLIEKLYPHNSKNPDLRGNVIDIDVYADGERTYAENYTSAYSSFFMSSRGYGSFFDTFARGRYQLAVNGITQIYHQTSSLNWYIFYGPTGDKIHKKYYNVIGKPKYIPIWACGPIFWRDQNNGGKDEILDDIQKFTDLKIPLTACWVDRPYSHGGHEWSQMDFTEKFSEPEKWIKTINEKYGMQFMTWVGPMTFSDNDFPGLLPNYPTYIDLTNPEAVYEFERRLSDNQYSMGVRGHKMDRADENFPLTAAWKDQVPESERRNKYIYLYSKTINRFLANAHGKNQFNYARAAIHRTQPYLSAVWGGDVRPNWQGMAGNMANALRCGFMGFPMWGGDTGGYLGEGNISEQLYIRWLQFGVWNGMFEVKIDGAGGTLTDRPPWKYSEQLQAVYRDVSNQRMKLLPYIYSCANTSDQNGVLMKPLTYMYPDDKNTYTIWDEFIFGDAFLVAPLFSEDNSREVYFPAGKWYDYNNPGKIYEGSKSIKLDVPLQNIPVFVKENSIYITGNIFQSNAKIWDGSLQGNETITIHIIPGQENSGITFSYVDYLDNDKIKKLSLNHIKNQVNFTSDSFIHESVIEISIKNKPKMVVLNGESQKIKFNPEKEILIVKIEKKKDINLKIQY